MRIGIAGITGRMGQLLVSEARRANLTVAGGTTRPGTAVTQIDGVPVFPTIEALCEAADLVIDFTNHETVEHHARAMIASKTRWVLGSTGLTTALENRVAEAAKEIPVVYAANFSPGITLMLRLAEIMAASLPPQSYDAEILETHHRLKKDAPSGTAIALGRAVAAARGQNFDDVATLSREGITGERPTGHIGFAALRGGAVPGDHTLSFLSDSEHLSVTYHAVDRRVFAEGAVKAAVWLGGKAVGLYSMRDVLNLT